MAYARASPSTQALFTIALVARLSCARSRTYIVGPLEAARQWVKKQEDWQWQEIATGHDAMVTAPAELAHMLAAIG